jgi:hypothetical protein
MEEHADRRPMTVRPRFVPFGRLEDGGIEAIDGERAIARLISRLLLRLPHDRALKGGSPEKSIVLKH